MKVSLSVDHLAGRGGLDTEAGMRKNEKESKSQYLDRLKRTALSIPTAVVKKAVMDMRRRLRSLQEAEGSLFIE